MIIYRRACEPCNENSEDDCDFSPISSEFLDRDPISNLLESQSLSLNSMKIFGEFEVDSCTFPYVEITVLSWLLGLIYKSNDQAQKMEE